MHIDQRGRRACKFTATRQSASRKVNDIPGNVRDKSRTKEDPAFELQGASAKLSRPVSSTTRGNQRKTQHPAKCSIPLEVFDIRQLEGDDFSTQGNNMKLLNVLIFGGST